MAASLPVELLPAGYWVRIRMRTTRGGATCWDLRWRDPANGRTRSLRFMSPVEAMTYAWANPLPGTLPQASPPSVAAPTPVAIPGPLPGPQGPAPRLAAHGPEASVIEAMAEWVEGLKDRISENTAYIYGRASRQLSDTVLATVPFSRLNEPGAAELVRQALEQMRGQGYSASTTNLAQKALGSFCRARHADGVLTSNPAARIPRYRVTPTKRRQAHSAVSIERLRLEIACPGADPRVGSYPFDPDDPGYRVAFIVGLMAYHGLRPGEAIALTWADVRNGLLDISKTMGQKELKAPKSGSARLLKICEPIQADLDALRADEQPPDERIVTAPTAKDRDWNYYRNQWISPAVARSGIGPFAAYEGRHTFASLFLHGGGMAGDLRGQLGHTGPNRTTDQYVHYYRLKDGAPITPLEKAVRLARAEIWGHPTPWPKAKRSTTRARRR